jgi:acyl dehydratase
MTNTIFRSEKESNRFKMNILRVNMESLDIKDLSQSIHNNNIDLTILRIPCENLYQISKLEVLGFSYYQTDTLVYYYVNLVDYLPNELKNDNISFRKATLNDSIEISNMVEQIFPGYTNHYNSNPYIDKQNILEGYKEWVLDFIEKENKFVFLVMKSGINIGFATCSILGDEAEGVLYGVLPEFAGGGVYSDIIRYTQQFMKNLGIKKMKVSTQVQNYAVQKVWSREGFSMLKSFATIHINSLLNYTCLPKIDFDIFITDEDIKNYGMLSGDINPVHFDDLFAKNLGFNQRIAHGLIANAEMSKYFGMDFPGNGTLFMSYYYKFFKPLYPNQKYRVTISVPYFDDLKSLYICLVKIYDNENSLCLMSYNNLMKK